MNPDGQEREAGNNIIHEGIVADIVDFVWLGKQQEFRTAISKNLSLNYHMDLSDRSIRR